MSRPAPTPRPPAVNRHKLQVDPQVRRWIDRMTGDPTLTPPEVDEGTLRYIIGEVLARRKDEFVDVHLTRALEKTTPVLSVPKVTSAVEDLGHMTTQPEFRRFWESWTVPRRRACDRPLVEGTKALMAAMSIPGYTTHGDTAHEDLHEKPALRAHFERLAAACGRDFQVPGYSTAMANMQGPLAEECHQHAQAAVIEILKYLRDDLGYSEVGKRWLIDGTLVPGWAPQRGPRRGEMPDGLTKAERKAWKAKDDARRAREDAAIRQHAPDMGFRVMEHSSFGKREPQTAREAGGPALRGVLKSARGLYHVVLVEQATGLVAAWHTQPADLDEAMAIVPLLSDLYRLWPELHDDKIAKCIAGDSAWDEDPWCRLCELDYGIAPVFRWHTTPVAKDELKRAKGKHKDARFPIPVGASRSKDVSGRTGDGRLVCARHGKPMEFTQFDPASRVGLRPGQSSKEGEFRIRGRCNHDEGPLQGPCGELGLQAMWDWSNFTRIPHHPHGNPKSYAFRRAMLFRLNQVEGAFSALKSANRTGTPGADRMRIRQAVTYDALLSLAHLGRAALVVADQRQQRGVFPYGPFPAPRAKAPTTRSTRAHASKPVSPSVARRRARRRPPATTTAAAAPVQINPIRKALDARTRPQNGDKPKWAA